MGEVTTEWNPEAEWTVEFLRKPQMEILRVTEIQAPSEGLALMFAFRYLHGEGIDCSKEFLKHLKTERVS